MRAPTVRHVLLTAFAAAAAGCGHAHASSGGIDYQPKRGMLSEVVAADEQGPVAEETVELAKGAPRQRMALAADTAEPARGGAQAHRTATARGSDEKLVIDGR